MKIIGILVLVLGLMFCITSAPSGVIFVSEPLYDLLIFEEWSEFKRHYIRSFGEVQVTGQIQNQGGSSAQDVYLIVFIYATPECKQCVYEGKEFICQKLDAGELMSFALKHEFEFISQDYRKGIKFGISAN